MIFDFESVDSLPPLAWCAHVSRTGVVHVRHGSGVETSSDAFVEGAWDGEFSRMDFDEAVVLAGSGGRLQGDGVVFCAPFHPLDYLYVLAERDEFLVSNSLAFLFTEARDRPDIHYPDYFFDLVVHSRRGLPNYPIAWPTAGGRRIRPFRVCNLRVTADLNYHELPKALPPPPSCYSDYYGQLLRSVTGVANNAVDPGRKRTFRLVSAVSKGYDCTAAAALASKAGGREAVTYAESSVDGDLADDSGIEIAASLGMQVTEYDRTGVRRLPGIPEAEFFSNPGNLGEVGLRTMERQLEGALFTTGRHGEDSWTISRRAKYRDLREPDNPVQAGRGTTDFRIRVGYLNFPVPYICAMHGPHIYAITRSREMRPWTLGNRRYDRPIARRIAEEAGVPRDSFGQRKTGGAGRALRGLNEASQRDFLAFCESEVPPAILRNLDHRTQVERDREHFRMIHIRNRYGILPLMGPLLDWAGLDRWHAMWNSINLYRFHWGYEKIRSRYQV